MNIYSFIPISKTLAAVFLHLLKNGIPWDLFGIFSALSAEPGAAHLRLKDIPGIFIDL
jgi:hypothetical protein